jgi:hypothetical protein
MILLQKLVHGDIRSHSPNTLVLFRYVSLPMNPRTVFQMASFAIVLVFSAIGAQLLPCYLAAHPLVPCLSDACQLSTLSGDDIHQFRPRLNECLGTFVLKIGAQRIDVDTRFRELLYDVFRTGLLP